MERETDAPCGPLRINASCAVVCSLVNTATLAIAGNISFKSSSRLAGNSDWTAVTPVTAVSSPAHVPESASMLAAQRGRGAACNSTPASVQTASRRGPPIETSCASNSIDMFESWTACARLANVRG